MLITSDTRVLLKNQLSLQVRHRTLVCVCVYRRYVNLLWIYTVFAHILGTYSSHLSSSTDTIRASNHSRCHFTSFRNRAKSYSVPPSYLTPPLNQSVFSFSVSERAEAQADDAVQSLNEIFLARRRPAKRAVTVRNERPIPLPFEP